MDPCDSNSTSIFGTLQRAPLLVGDQAGAPRFDRATLNRKCPATTLNLNQKLGHVYEDAMAALIADAPTLELIAKNLQIFGAEGRTLGELDFVVYDSVSDKHIHLELAVKFYLSIQQDGAWQFPGPDPRDNWGRKLERMRTHQFKLSQSKEAKALLHDKFGIATIETQQLIYGRLFDPLGADERPCLPAMAPDAQRGRWLNLRDWDRHFSENTRPSLIPKSLWPMEMDSIGRSRLTPLSIQVLKEAATERCVMFATTDSEEPYFLVPDS
ncbi:MAG: DUF1853 family protein [Opitutales bacterium]